MKVSAFAAALGMAAVLASSAAAQPVPELAAEEAVERFCLGPKADAAPESLHAAEPYIGRLLGGAALRADDGDPEAGGRLCYEAKRPSAEVPPGERGRLLELLSVMLGDIQLERRPIGNPEAALRRPPERRIAFGALSEGIGRHFGAEGVSLDATAFDGALRDAVADPAPRNPKMRWKKMEDWNPPSPTLDRRVNLPSRASR